MKSRGDTVKVTSGKFKGITGVIIDYDYNADKHLVVSKPGVKRWICNMHLGTIKPVPVRTCSSCGNQI
jgi:transcription antitermination factor NusG